MTQQVGTSSKWPHRWAWVLCLATFPLLWIGGLITTTDAGMAVPDWPGTYGYNMFLYPWQTWFFGPWDLFIEHGHRLFASGVGLITIIFLVVVWRNRQPSWLRWLAVIALILVIIQGALGGMRVVLNARILAMLHGCIGPLFFALTSALVVLTNPKREGNLSNQGNSPWPGWLGLWLPFLIYAQITAGASLRHVPEGGRFSTFSDHVLMHLTLAAAILVGVFYTTYRTNYSSWKASSALRWLGKGLAFGVLLQISLGFATWFVKYRLPDWLNNPASDYARFQHWAQSVWPGTLTDLLTRTATLEGGWTETHTVTAHSALGSLLLALATALALLPKPAEKIDQPSL